MVTHSDDQELRNTGSSFSNDVLKLVSGTTIAFAVTLLAAPFLTRFYSPEDFGNLAIFVSIISILGVVGCLRYQMAILIPEEDDEAASVFNLSLISAVIVTLVTLLLVLLGGRFFLRLIDAIQLSSLLWLIPPTIALEGINLALIYWNIRRKRYIRMSLARFGNSFTMTGTQVSLGFLWGASNLVLIGAYSLGSFLSGVYLFTSTFKKDWNLFRDNFRARSILQCAKRYRKFPLYDVWAVLLNNFSWALPAFMLSAFFSPTIVGYYSLGHRLLRMPMSLIGQAVSQVFFQRASVARYEENLSQVVEDIFRRLVTIGLMPFLVLSVTGEEVFSIVFGQNWAEAGVYVQIMAVWTFFWFISSPLSNIFRLLEQQEFSLKINVLIFATRFLSLWIGGILSSPRIAISLFALTGTIMYGYLGVAIFNLADVPIRKGVRILYENILTFIPVGLVLITLKTLSAPDWILIGISVLAVAIHLLLNRKELIRGSVGK